tara:strand:+ start:769 stop:1551 length:783 start_codon:yes stop_codon:yes gene_type:complete
MKDLKKYINKYLMDIFYYESSEIKWCESKYVVSYYICEFMNSITGFIYIFFSMLLYWNLKKIYNNGFKLKNYFLLNKIQKYQLNVILSNFGIGLFTIYFHCTLSVAGQFLDEISILFLILLYDIEGYNYYFKTKIVIGLLIFLMFPYYNRFIMASYGFTRLKQIINIYNNLQNNDFKSIRLFRLSVSSFILSFILWIADLSICDKLIISTHWLWHIFSSMSIYFMSNFIFIYQFKKSKYNIDFDFAYFGFPIYKELHAII